MPVAAIMAIAGIMLLFNPNADPMTKEQKVTQGAYLTAHAIDWGQTRHMTRHQDRYYEANPLIGKHPSANEVDKYMAASALLHTGITKSMPDKYRGNWFLGSFVIKFMLVGNNVQAGLGVEF